MPELIAHIGKREGMGEARVKQALAHLQTLGEIDIVAEYVYTAGREQGLGCLPCWKCELARECRPGGKVEPARCPFYEMF